MKKIPFISFILLLITHVCFGQINWEEYSQTYLTGVTDKDSAIGLITAIPKLNNSFWTIYSNDNLGLKLHLDTAFKRTHPVNVVAVATFDTARAQFFLHGVNSGNAAQYQFRVVDSTGKNVVPWSAITRFTTPQLNAQAGMPLMAYLGGYKTALGKKIIVDVRSSSTHQIIATSVVAWVPIQPLITNIYTSKELNQFFKQLTYPWSVKGDKPVPRELKLPSTNDNLIFKLRAEIYKKEQVEYQVLHNWEVITPWKANDYDNSFIWLKDFKPGAYQLNIRYAAQPEHVTSYRFEVEPAWYQSIAFKIIAGILIAAFFGAFLFLMLYIRQRSKTRHEQANKTRVQLELKSIYAQLNPHFVFNALSSIQGLINRQDIKGANSYLSDFARLMRESLNNSNRNEVSLKEEIQMLNTYLKLEQLRFGFSYQIIVDDALNIYDTSIPSLLLQPLVENAVKHGVSSLQEQGKIELKFTRQKAAMLVIIHDNGQGFDSQQLTTGFGLKLTRDRIQLLNELNKEQYIQLEINSGTAQPTVIQLTFNHWFL